MPRIAHRDLPVFALPVPASRIYVVTSPVLAAAVQRASRTLSFAPLVPDITRRVLGLSDKIVAIARHNVDPDPGEPGGFITDIHDLVYTTLGPGDALAELTREAAGELSRQVQAETARLERLEARARASGKGGDEELGEAVPNLLEWVRHFVTVGTARFLYGDANPIALDPELEQSFWDFDHGLGSLLTGILPRWTARRAWTGREKLAKALVEYLEAGRDRDASKIVQERIRIAREHGFDIEGIARSELSFLFAGIVNTATTTFWLILHVFADPVILAAVRAELEAVLERDQAGADAAAGQWKLSIESVKNGCPLLLAIFRECLRVGSDNFSTRLVKEDTLLADRWFLPKNSIVQIAGGVIHADADIWGADVASFNPGRFLDRKHPMHAHFSRQQQQQQKVANGHAKANANEGTDGAAANSTSAAVNPHPAAFRAFGGGKTLCPGRHFATNEVVSFAAMIVLGFDLVPLDGRERLAVPPKDDRILPVHILEPPAGQEVRCRIRLRPVGERRRVRVVL